jgi:hypothetical protein
MMRHPLSPMCARSEAAWPRRCMARFTSAVPEARRCLHLDQAYLKGWGHQEGSRHGSRTGYNHYMAEMPGISPQVAVASADVERLEKPALESGGEYRLPWRPSRWSATL